MEFFAQVHLTMNELSLNPSGGHFPNSQVHNWNTHPRQLAESPHCGFQETCLMEELYLIVCYFLIALYFREGNNHWLAPMGLPLNSCMGLAKALSTSRCVYWRKTQGSYDGGCSGFLLVQKRRYFHSLATHFFQHFFPWVVKLEMYWVHIYFLCIITE